MNDAGANDGDRPSVPDSRSAGRRRLLIPEASRLQGDLAALAPAERAELLSHHYKQQQVEELVTAESRAFRGCAWTGGIFSGGFAMVWIGEFLSHYFFHRHLFPSGIPNGLEASGGWLASAGALLVLFSGLPGIFRFFRWIGAMRARRRLGKILVPPAPR
jgi:hypothetical protein